MIGPVDLVFIYLFYRNKIVYTCLLYMTIEKKTKKSV